MRVAVHLDEEVVGNNSTRVLAEGQNVLILHHLGVNFLQVFKLRLSFSLEVLDERQLKIL